MDFRLICKLAGRAAEREDGPRRGFLESERAGENLDDSLEAARDEDDDNCRARKV